MSTQEWDDRIKAINDAIESGNIERSSRAKLVQFNAWLCHSNAGMHFSKNYVQVCETVRFHLLRTFIEELERKNSFVQKLVIALTAAALLVAVPQIWFAYKADKRAEIVEEKEQEWRKEQKSISLTPILVQPQTNRQTGLPVTDDKTMKKMP